MKFGESLIWSLIAIAIKLYFLCKQIKLSPNYIIMRISELANLNANVSVSVTLQDLCEFFDEKVMEALASMKEPEEKYLSVDEVCEALRVSKPTVWRWSKSGYLQPKKLGRTPLFRQSDIDNLLNG